jgi:hypothetical protein
MPEPLDPNDAPPPATDPAWPAYGDTILEFAHAGARVRVDLREAVTRRTRDALVSLVGSHAFGVVTPENPGGRTLAARENAERVEALGSELVRAQLAAVRADGHGASSDHVERGYAIAAELSQVRLIAARNEQTAFYWFDGERMWLVPTRETEPSVPLPAAREELAAQVDDEAQGGR